MLALIPAILLACHLLAGLLTWRMWRGRATGGVARCRRCWYDLTGGLPEVCEPFVCPECGRADVTRSGLYKRQRRAGPAALMVVLQGLIGYGWFLGEVGRSGLVGAVPTTALVWIVDDIDSPGPLAASLTSRWRAGSIWPWQRRVYVRRKLDRWIGEHDPATHLVTYRRRAGEGDPLELWVTPWQSGGVRGRWIVATTTELADTMLVGVTSIREAMELAAQGRKVSLPPVAPGETSRAVRIAVLATIDGTYQFIRRDVAVTLDLDPVPPGQEVLHRVADPALVEHLRSTLKLVHQARPHNGSILHVLRFKGDEFTGVSPAPPGCSTAFEYTIEHRGWVIESGGFGHAWGSGGRLAFLDGPTWDECFDQATGTLNTAGLVLRIRPNHQHALSDLRMHSIWDGEIVVNLDEAEIERVGPAAR